MCDIIGCEPPDNKSLLNNADGISYRLMFRKHLFDVHKKQLKLSLG